jgi:uncharacterized protein YggT (Ycf19 family)
MVDDKLAVEEAERIAAYENIKSQVKHEVGEEIAVKSESRAAHETVPVDDIAVDMRHKAVDEVVSTSREVERGRVVARISQFIDYGFFLIYGLLGLRLLLSLLGARSSNAFVQFIYSITDPFYWPFRGIVPSPTTPEGFTLALPVVIAMVVYLLLHLAINGFLRIFAHRKTAV